MRLCLVVGYMLVLTGVGESQEQPPRGRPHGQVNGFQARNPRGPRGPASVFYTEVPAHDCDVILGRPSGHGITMSILGYVSLEGYIACGTKTDNMVRKTDLLQFPEGQPQEVLVDGLTPSTRYFYRLCWRRPGTEAFAEDTIRSFHTQRSPGEPFIFTVQADSHLDAPEAVALYTTRLCSALNDNPDFHIDLGDTFMTDYVTRDFLPSPGFLKVEVGKTTATVSYIKVQPTSTDNANASEIAFKYQLDARAQDNPSDSRKAEHAGEKS